MATGLFKMLQSVQSTDEMLGFLDSSTFDVLIEFDLNSRTFQKIYDVSKKYPIPLQDGSFEDMYVTLVEILIHPEDKMRFCVLMTELEKRLKESEIPGLVSEEFRIRLLSGSIIPIWFFPAGVAKVLSCLPFVYIYQLPLSIYIGRGDRVEHLWQMQIQFVWLLVLTGIFFFAQHRITRKVMVQGG